MVQCPDCALISIDPIPSAEIVAEGCGRLYSLQQGAEKREKILRGFAKSFRRGARFARQYLRGQTAPRILEVGAGDGYFAAGIRSVIPGARVTLLDIVQELVEYYRLHHDCEPVRGEFTADQFAGRDFDWIIFRDLLEHVRDPFRFLQDANRVVAKGGQIFFITPNGKEDFWLIHQRFLRGQGRSVLLLNHFHYFLPETLDRMLKESGFQVRHAFKFGLKQHRKGLGHREIADLGTQAIPRVVKARPIAELWRHSSHEVRDQLFSRPGLLSRAYSALVDRETQRTPYASPIGHEFFVVAEKR